MTYARIDAAISHLRSNRIVFEDGLSGDEIARVEKVHGFRFPPDLQRFLQTALPVSGGFPNWRSESEHELRHRYLDGPTSGLLFDVEHNDFWLADWGHQPQNISDAVSKACKHLSAVPRLVAVRSHHYLPSEPLEEGNPVFSVRQSDVACIGLDLPSYLLSLFKPGGATTKWPEDCRFVPIWTEVARTSSVRVPNMAGPPISDAEDEYTELCNIIQRAGFWAEIDRKGHGGVRFDRLAPTTERRFGVFWIVRRDFGWLLGIRWPRNYFIRDGHRVAELCLALLTKVPSPELSAGRPPDEIRREFRLVTIQDFTNMYDEFDRKIRAWERLGWREMSHGQMDDSWNKYGEKFGNPKKSGFTTPSPSATWDIAAIYLRDNEFRRLEADLTIKCLHALQNCCQPGEELLVLDWNHTCYFLNPHGGIADATKESWAVPVLPNGDIYIFLAQDFRFGIIGNCVDMTMCVFGQELLDALSASPPLIFRKRAWTPEQREQMERSWTEFGWQRLSTDEKDELLDRFGTQFEFFQRRMRMETPVIAEPTPSLTFAIAWTSHERESKIADLTLKILAALKSVTPPLERLYALDAIHWYEHYTFDPQRLTSASRDCWAQPLYSDDNYSIIFAPDFRFGVFGNPIEKSLCIFGQELLRAIADDIPSIAAKILRRNGRTLSV
jgi:hypothetical protein